MNNHPLLFQEYQLNFSITLRNKCVMAPMTRTKADKLGVPTDDMKEYYRRRAAAGLIITEGTVIRHDAHGHDFVPGIFTPEQIAGWKNVTNAVHQDGGLIFCQLWHVGRVSHPHFLKGNLPISASESEMKGRVTRIKGLNYGKSRSATITEINEIIQSYQEAANNAIQAGFDGVEIHGANGYLIDQFLHYHTNSRVDEYGGTPEKMSRFALEIVKACGDAVGYDRVGLRISPGAYLNEIVGDVRDGSVFAYLLSQLNQIPIAYVHTGNFEDHHLFPELENMTMTAFIRKHYRGTVMACGSYTIESAENGIKRKDFDLIAIGRAFLANPDLIKRLQNDEPLRDYHDEMLNTLW